MKEFSVKKCTVGKWKENTYLISTEDFSLLIDPGDEPQTISNTLFSPSQSPLKAIVATHGHFDHIASVQFFKELYNVPFGINFKDRRILNQSNLYRKLAHAQDFFPIPSVEFDLDNIDTLNIGLEVKIHKTPGHSEGSVSFEVGKCVFSGDILLINEIGRTDLPGGDVGKLKDSIQYLLDNFLGYRFYPGHGPDFILDDEKAEMYKNLLWI